MANDWHVKWLREGVRAWNRRRKKVRFTPDLSGVRFFDLLPPDFRDRPKSSRFFEGINLSGADISEGDLSGLNFARANFTNAKLSFANLSLTNFTKARFVHAKLNGAFAENSVFDDSDFTEASLDGAVLRDNEFKSAKFIDVKIDRQIIAKENNLADAFFTRAEYTQLVGRAVSRLLPSARARVAEKTEFNTFDVMYATNRVPVLRLGELVDFSEQRANSLSYGVCEVVIPKGHRVGSIGSPLWRRIFGGDDRLYTQQIIGLNPDLYWQHWLQCSLKMTVKAPPTLFVHGYNTSFSDAVLRAAQIGHDLRLGQGIGLFSWPSQGRESGYIADMNSVDATKLLLADFVEDFVSNYGDSGINIVAHSMGCRLVTLSLELLLNKGSQSLKKIKNLVFAAADVDAGYMNTVASGLVGNVARATNYASEIDQALKIAAWLGAGSKVGLAPPTFLVAGLDTILVNDQDQGSFLHGYIGTSRAVIADLYHLLLNNLPPDQRHGLVLETSSAGSFWRFSK
jgi:esterase/lipase superfamily enzyme